MSTKLAKTDTLMLECVHCKSFIPVTTYDGPCNEEKFSVDEAPLKIIAEVNEESRKGRIQCDSCGMHIALAVRFMAYENQLSVQQQYNKKWKES